MITSKKKKFKKNIDNKYIQVYYVINTIVQRGYDGMSVYK